MKWTSIIGLAAITFTIAPTVWADCASISESGNQKDNIQDCIDNNLVIPPGDYMINDSLELSDGDSLIGSGWNATRIYKDAGNHSLVKTHSQGVDTFVISDLELDGGTAIVGCDERDPQTICGGRGIELSFATYGLVKNLRVVNTIGHLIRCEQCRHIHFGNLYLKNSKDGYGMGFQALSNAHIFIDNVEIYGAGADGIDIKNLGWDHDDDDETDPIYNGPFRISNVYVHDFGNKDGGCSEPCAGLDIRAPSQMTNITVNKINQGESGIRIYVKKNNSNDDAGGQRSNISNFSCDATNSTDSTCILYVVGTGNNALDVVDVGVGQGWCDAGLDECCSWVTEKQLAPTEGGITCPTQP